MERSRRRRLLLTAVSALVLVGAAPIALFVANGLWLAARNRPVMAVTSRPPAPPPRAGDEVTILAYNIAKGFAHLGGLDFEPRPRAAARLRAMAEVIRAEEPDLVFLSEVLREYPGGLDQAVTLAEATGMHAVAFGEHYNVGLPGYRVVGGAAILSRWPLEPVTVLDLAGRRPFWVTTNSRRALFAAASLGGERVLLASLHDDSFSPETNLAQVRQLLAFTADRAAILAGDLNAAPGEPPIEAIRGSGRFAAAWDGPPTYPSEAPEQRIDLIMVPAAWQLVEHHVVESTASDHRPAVSTFRLPTAVR